MQNLFDKFIEVKVLVFGDIMLDQYWWGSVDRMSPEAPVPVVNFQRKSLVVGGAANVAANVISLGATPILFGVVGNDEEGLNLKSAISEKAISVENIITFGNRPTTTKTRIIGNNQQITRIDSEITAKISSEEELKIWVELSRAIETVDVILISDYAKGFVTDELTSKIIKLSKKLGKIILVDPKGKNYSKYKNASVLTPNQKEALAATKFETDDDLTVENAGNKLAEDLSLEALIITRGKKGMTLFQNGKATKNLKASARKVFDVTGAGDTVIAALAVAIGAGASFFEAAKMANVAAGIVVEKMGTAVIDLTKLQDACRKN